MQYFTAIRLDSAPAIQAWAKADIQRQQPQGIVNGQHRFKHELPPELMLELASELNGLEVLYMQSYCRQPGNRQSIHIDGTPGLEIDNAVNIPLKGCANSQHVYYKGNYRKITRQVDGLTFSDLVWLETPQVADILYLDQPTLVRVDHPHSAQANSLEERWILTMRFKGNPSYEELCTRLKVINN